MKTISQEFQIPLDKFYTSVAQLTSPADPIVHLPSTYTIPQTPSLVKVSGTVETGYVLSSG
jgi:hypothetical protein